jgi:ribosomal protein S18 acetylase RimI-like enzyme
MAILIEPYRPEFAQSFYDLNMEWLETYFYVEDFDREVLSKPQQYILDRGGNLFFIVEGPAVYGTVALMPYDQTTFELTKMAVSPKFRGKKMGQELMKHCIRFAQKEGKNLVLYSNTKLKNAIHIYKKYGFIEIPIEEDSPYDRSNIKMMLTI